MTRKTLILVLIASISNIIHGQQLVVDGDGTSGKEIIARNEGNSNSHTYFSAFTASDQFNTTPTFEGLRSRGTLDNPQDVNSGDRLLLLTGRPYINGVYRPASTIEFKTGDSPSVSSHPTYITISTTDNNSTIRQERLRIAANGSIGVGSNDPKSKLHITGGDVYIEDMNNGVIMTSPNGQCWRYTPDNSGNLIGVMITCP